MPDIPARILFCSLFPGEHMPDSFPKTLTYRGVTFGYGFWASSPIHVREVIILTKGNTKYQIEVAGKTPEQLTHTIRKLFCKLAGRIE